MSTHTELAGPKAVASLSARHVDETSGTLKLMREALFLNDGVYAAVRDSRAPMGRGFPALLWILIIVVAARGISLATGLLTTPRLDIMQSQFYAALTGMGIYQRMVEGSPEFAQQFWQGYIVLWETLRLFGGFPSTTGTLSTIVVLLLFTLLNWLLFGLFAHWTARWFGGQASLGQFLAALAFSYAPLLLTVIVIFPGAHVAAPVIVLLLMVTQYQAIKTTHELTPGYSLATLIVPYLIGLVADIGIILFALAYGIAQIPYLEEALSAWRIIQLF